MWTSNNHYKMECHNMPNGWNDVVSSMEVYRTNNGSSAVGKWTGITATEIIDTTYNIGF